MWTNETADIISAHRYAASAITITDATGSTAMCSWRSRRRLSRGRACCSVAQPKAAAIACCTAASEIGYGKSRRIALVDSEVSNDVLYQTASSAARRSVLFRQHPVERSCNGNNDLDGVNDDSGKYCSELLGDIWPEPTRARSAVDDCVRVHSRGGYAAPWWYAS